MVIHICTHQTHMCVISGVCVCLCVNALLACVCMCIYDASNQCMYTYANLFNTCVSLVCCLAMRAPTNTAQRFSVPFVLFCCRCHCAVSFDLNVMVVIFRTLTHETHTHSHPYTLALKAQYKHTRANRSRDSFFWSGQCRSAKAREEKRKCERVERLN